MKVNEVKLYRRGFEFTSGVLERGCGQNEMISDVLNNLVWDNGYTQKAAPQGVTRCCINTFLDLNVPVSPVIFCS